MIIFGFIIGLIALLLMVRAVYVIFGSMRSPESIALRRFNNAMRK